MKLAAGAQDGTVTKWAARMFSAITDWIFSPGKLRSTAVLWRSLRPTAEVPMKTIFPFRSMPPYWPLSTSTAERAS